MPKPLATASDAGSGAHAPGALRLAAAWGQRLRWRSLTMRVDIAGAGNAAGCSSSATC